MSNDASENILFNWEHHNEILADNFYKWHFEHCNNAFKNNIENIEKVEAMSMELTPVKLSKLNLPLLDNRI